MQKKHRKSTLPAIIPNQPTYQVRWYFMGGDGAKFRAEREKHERNRRRLILSPEQPPTMPRIKPRRLKLSKGKTATIKTVYPQVRTINN